ncbi:MAG: 1-phosphofructokinase, partial [Ruminococcus sp.]|nr:1-phosphofructokinase [Ruminococcus sp.]
MIYTVTFNPAVDYVIHTDEIKTGCVNRTKSEEIYFGGKGINVSFVLAELGIKSVALGFIAGFTGTAIENAVKNAGIETDFVHLEDGFSRINIKIKFGQETEINGRGADIPDYKIKELFHKLDRLKDGDILILAGSVPASLPSDMYQKILEYVDGKNIRTVVDAEKNLLMKVMRYKPFLIKPNDLELGDIFGRTIETTEDVTEYALKLKKLGAVNVLVSRAEKGAVLVDEHENIHVCGVCKGTVKNSVGAGDSMIAGFIAGCQSGRGYDYALKLGTASGGATAFSDNLAKREYIIQLFNT